MDEQYRVTETLQEFLDRHTADAINRAFRDRNQNVEIVRLESRGHFMVLDAPEYDFMHHRMSYAVSVTSQMPLCGYIQLQWPKGYDEKPAYDQAKFNEHRSFGDALEEIASHISRRIEED